MICDGFNYEFVLSINNVIKNVNEGEYMKIALTSKGEKLESEVDTRFGRCQYFIVVDTDTMEFEALENSSAMASGGAGPQAAQAISKMGVEAVITGNVGPNAFEALGAADIKIITGSSGTVKEMVEKFKNDNLAETNAPNVGSHSGMRRGG